HSLDQGALSSPPPYIPILNHQQCLIGEKAMGWFWSSSNSGSDSSSSGGAEQGKPKADSHQPLGTAGAGSASTSAPTSSLSATESVVKDYLKHIKVELEKQQSLDQQKAPASDIQRESALDDASSRARRSPMHQHKLYPQQQDKKPGYTPKEIEQIVLENCAEAEYEMLRCQASPKTWKDQFTGCESFRRAFNKCVLREKERLEKADIIE
ncbi:hypothetical protein EV182_007131, partial [Spiromyces aspiralis]